LVQEARKRDQLEGKGFYNSKFQKEMGSKGGIKGGSANTKTQFLTRQKVGQTYGRETGINNQSDKQKAFVLGGSVWAFRENPKNHRNCKNHDTEIFCLVTTKSSFVDVARTLNTFVPNSIPMDKVASMYKLIRGERPQMYGWRIVYTLIRSEVREGIHKFSIQYPNEILRFENDFAVNEGFE
jgi:hypothetical protein